MKSRCFSRFSSRPGPVQGGKKTLESLRNICPPCPEASCVLRERSNDRTIESTMRRMTWKCSASTAWRFIILTQVMCLILYTYNLVMKIKRFNITLTSINKEIYCSYEIDGEIVSWKAWHYRTAHNDRVTEHRWTYIRTANGSADSATVHALLLF